MEIINLNKNVEELFLAKRSIEQYWLDNKLIESKLQLSDFVQKLNMSETIFVNTNSDIFPFSIVITDDETYLFVVDENIDELINALELIEYNINNLVALTNADLYFNVNIDELNHFIINGKTMLNKKSYKPKDDITIESLIKLAKPLTDIEIQNIMNNGLESFDVKNR